MGLHTTYEFRVVPSISTDAILCLISENDLRAVRMVAAHEHFGRAAQQLGMSIGQLDRIVRRCICRLGCASTRQLIALLRQRWLIEARPEEVAE